MLAHGSRKTACLFLWKRLLSAIICLNLYVCNLEGQSPNIEGMQDNPETQTATESLKDQYAEPVAPPLHYWFLEPVSLSAQDKLLQKSIIRTDPAHSFKHLGVICKWEYRLEKTVQFPVKFRLGEYHYVQKLEGKSVHND